MADNVTFVGGPCNGTSHVYPAGSLTSGVVSCGGIEYVVLGIAPNVYTAHPADQPTQQQAGAATYAPDLYRAYGDLRRSIAHRLRPAVTRAQQYDRIALQTLARRTRRKGH